MEILLIIIAWTLLLIHFKPPNVISFGVPLLLFIMVSGLLFTNHPGVALSWVEAIYFLILVSLTLTLIKHEKEDS